MPATPISSRPIPSTGEPMPVIGLGTWPMFDVGADESARRPVREVVRQLLDAGAQASTARRCTAGPRVWWATCSPISGRGRAPFSRPKSGPAAATKAVAEMRHSAASLRTRVIDLMQIHNLIDWRTHLATMRQMKEEGRIRFIGLTHYTARALPYLVRILETEPGIDFVQCGYSLAERMAEQQLLLGRGGAWGRGHRQPAAWARQPVEPGARSAAAGLGWRNRLHKLGPAAAQIHPGPARGDLCDPCDPQPRAYGRRSRRRLWPPPGRRRAAPHPRPVGDILRIQR